MTTKVDSLGMTSDGSTTTEVDLMEAYFTNKTAAAALADLTDSSGGSASSARTITNIDGDLTNVADAGTTSAQAASTVTKLNLVRDAITEVMAKANAIAAVVGVSAVTDNSGGTAADGTIGAIGTVTAATTGSQASNVNAGIETLAEYMYITAMQINKCAKVCGVAPLDIQQTGKVFSSTVAVMTMASGSAGDPGVTAAAFNAKLAAFANNIATMAARCTAMTTAAGTNPVSYE